MHTVDGSNLPTIPDSSRPHKYKQARNESMLVLVGLTLSDIELWQGRETQVNVRVQREDTSF